MLFSGDTERQVGVPVTPVCDRHSNTVAKIQIGESIVDKKKILLWLLPCWPSGRGAGRQGFKSQSSQVISVT